MTIPILVTVISKLKPRIFKLRVLWKYNEVIDKYYSLAEKTILFPASNFCREGGPKNA